MSETCKLWLEDVYEDQWRSECGRDWYFTEGGPHKNNLNYCASCGKRLEVVEGKPVTEPDWSTMLSILRTLNQPDYVTPENLRDAYRAALEGKGDE